MDDRVKKLEEAHKKEGANIEVLPIAANDSHWMTR
jgi:hypothetical protein